MDHCTRLCHASSVAALFEGIGSGAVSTTYGDVINAEVAIVTGSNSTANHPVASSFFKQARRNGTTIIYIDPRADRMADHADIYCQLKPGTDVAFYNAVMHEVIRLGLTDDDFIANRTSNYEALKRTVADYPPERGEQITGVPAELIRRVARAWGTAKSGIIFWGMGISQHTTGTDNARCLIALCSITGNVGKPGAGLHPLRGQNNVQGASDMGLVPMFYPDYQKADDPGVKARFEQAWGSTDLDPKRGLTVTEIIGSALKGGVRGMYMLGENPFLSDPNINKVRKALSALEFLVVQDIFLTETAEFADVILPASSYLEKDGTYTNTDRRVQLGRKVLDPPGQARVDWEVVQDIANRIGLDWRYASSREIFEEMVSVIPSYRNLSYDNLGLTGKLYPNPDPEHSDGTVVMFTEKFNTNDGLAHLVPAEWLPARELPDEEYPFVLNTGRMLEHWHTGSMTRRSYALDAIAPKALVFIHPDDAAELGLEDGDLARVSSRRGVDRAGSQGLAPGGQGQLLHTVPLPGGGGEPADDRRDRPGREDPRVQVLRGADRKGRWLRPRPAAPGVEARAGKFPGPSLIPALNAIQERAGWLPREELVALSRDVRRPLYEIEGLVSFYPHFRTDPPVKAELRVCHDLSCWLRGADERIAAIKERYGSDADVEVVEGSCLGRCDIAPACTVNEAPVPLDAGRRRRGGGSGNGAANRPHAAPRPPAAGSAARWPNDPYPAPEDRYAVLRDVLAGRLDAADIIAALKDTGLRGMGGAGFPTGRKWDLVAAQETTPKYVICNADESEPGTFKDREILATQPHLVLEGMLLGMLAVGAEEGWVFIRHEYGPEEQVIRREIEHLREAGLIGPDAGRLRPAAVRRGVHLAGRLHPRRGVGAHRVHGRAPRRAAEQAAVPRHLRPARQADADELGRDVRPRPGHRRQGRVVVERAGPGRPRGPEVLRRLGPRGTARRVLRPDGHHRPRTARPGRRVPAAGASAPSSRAARPPTSSGRTSWTWNWTSARCRQAGSMLGSGAIVVMAEGTDLLAAAVNVLRFFRDESCGKCVPCRVGSAKAHVILDGLLGAGGGPAEVDGDVRDLAEVMRRTSICGLGQVALGPVMSVLPLAEDHG